MFITYTDNHIYANYFYVATQNRGNSESMYIMNHIFNTPILISNPFLDNNDRLPPELFLYTKNLHNNGNASMFESCKLSNSHFAIIMACANS